MALIWARPGRLASAAFRCLQAAFTVAAAPSYLGSALRCGAPHPLGVRRPRVPCHSVAARELSHFGEMLLQYRRQVLGIGLDPRIVALFRLPFEHWDGLLVILKHVLNILLIELSAAEAFQLLLQLRLFRSECRL